MASAGTGRHRHHDVAAGGGVDPSAVDPARVTPGRAERRLLLDIACHRTRNLSRVGAGLAIVVFALGVAACATASAPVPSSPDPMISPSTGSPGGATDDGYRGGAGGMIAGPATTTTALPRTGPVAGEWLDPAAVSALQSAVDHGAQPWRLDPQMTALAFTRAQWGWVTPLSWRSAPNAVLVDDGAGGAVSLRLVQPGRTGATGVWTVSAGSWVR